MKSILFLTGTRADYGKLKTLIKAVEESHEFCARVFVCGMHLLDKYGSTYKEILADGYSDIHIANDINFGRNTAFNLAGTIKSLESYVQEARPDLIVVHGDRADALAGAVVGALENIMVAHIEGGELSGTIDDSIRHAITKFAHLHFTCNNEASERLLQLGEEPRRIFTIGSPDIDAMLHTPRPSIEAVKQTFGIPFDIYSIALFHPVTTEYTSMGKKTHEFVDALLKSDANYVVIYPNNDLGNEFIMSEYERLKKNDRFQLFPSIHFESFLTLLENSELIIGNSSAGIRESGVYGIPGIDIGSRQQGRYSLASLPNVQHTDYDSNEILDAIKSADQYRVTVTAYGTGNSTESFMNVLNDNATWSLPIQKQFCDQ